MQTKTEDYKYVARLPNGHWCSVKKTIGKKHLIYDPKIKKSFWVSFYTLDNGEWFTPDDLAGETYPANEGGLGFGF